MNATRIPAVALAALTVALAGCTGGFTIDQTEPIRIQLEGAPETVVVHEGETGKEVNLQTCPDTSDPCDVENVDVQLKVHRVDSDACRVKVTIKTVSGEVLDEIVIDVDELGSGASGTVTGDTNSTGNGTMTATQTGGTASSGDTVIQNLVVNVKGNKNIIVLTQALEGSAEVNVQAIKASGNAQVDADQDDSDDMTWTGNSTTSATMTNTTGY